MSAAQTPLWLERYRRLFETTWQDTTPIDAVRFVVLDTETTGLNPKTDKLVTIGAVSVVGGDIVLDDAFDAMLQLAYNTSAVAVHGVTRQEAEGGLTEWEALAKSLDYLRDGVIVGHPIGHDVDTFNVALERHYGLQLQNRALDTMELTLHLERDGAFGGDDRIQGFSLDALCDLFGVTPHDRHTAAGDAFITALIFQRLLRLAKKAGRTTLGALAEPYEPDEPSA